MKAIVSKRLNRRIGTPSVNAPKLSSLEAGTTIEIVRTLTGDKIEGNDKWYQTTDGFYVWSGGVEVLISTDITPSETVLSRLINYNSLIGNIGDPIKNSLGNNINIAILDTGVNQNHPDLELKMPSFDFTKSKIGFDDKNGHGSHVAGLISARSKKSTGIIGIAPLCNIQNLKVLLDTGDSVGDILIKAMNQMLNQPNLADAIDIINLSLSITVPEYMEAVSVIEKLSEQSILVAAAGEDEKLLISHAPLCPAFSSKVVSVGVIDKDFFSANPNSVFNHRIDYLMPSLNLYSCSNEEHNEYQELKGSSMATAIVSGIIALYLSFFNQKGDSGLNFIKSELDKIAIPYTEVSDLSKLQLIKPKYQ